ncbi:MAG: 50S ribosomal protein L25, partial [Rhodospirillaceae bacterium]|nr:50S ribosomal protein L25 [Rhodospirillaceae bacterium]
MSDQLTLSAEARDRAGKGASRALRREGRVPAVIYGNKEDPVSIHVEEKVLNKQLSNGHFMNTVV